MKKIRKIKYSNLLLLIIFTYVLLQIVASLIAKSTNTFVIENEKLELKNTAKGLIIRDEYLIKSNQNGTITSTANDGEKLKKGDTIAVIYKNIKNLYENKSAIKKLNEEIEALKIDKENSNSNFSSELINIQINNKIEQREKLHYENNKGLNYLNIQTSGTISYKYDGYENIYTVDSIENLTIEDIENTENNYKNINTENEFINESDIIARVIESSY